MTIGNGIEPRTVLVLGAGGMAGHVVRTYLAEAGHRVTGASRSLGPCSEVQLDVTDHRALEDFISAGRFDVIVNCVGALVADSERDPSLAIRLNSLLPHQLSKIASQVSARLIHLSTDCVFSGASGGYREDAFRDGDSVYDRAKALGEVDSPDHLTLRMSIIGPEIREHGTGLMHWFLGQNGLVNGYAGARWNGLTTLELATAINSILSSSLSGIYNLVPDDSVSKFELLQLIREEFSRPDLDVVPVEEPIVDKTLIDTRRTSPYTVGSDHGYRGMIRRLYRWIERHPELYGNDRRYVANHR